MREIRASGVTRAGTGGNAGPRYSTGSIPGLAGHFNPFVALAACDKSRSRPSLVGADRSRLRTRPNGGSFAVCGRSRAKIARCSTRSSAGARPRTVASRSCRHERVDPVGANDGSGRTEGCVLDRDEVVRRSATAGQGAPRRSRAAVARPLDVPPGSATPSCRMSSSTIFSVTSHHGEVCRSAGSSSWMRDRPQAVASCSRPGRDMVRSGPR